MLANLNRPQRFNEVIGQDSIVSNIREQSRKGRYFSTYVFAGQFGSGKTTLARLLAKAANCTNKKEDGEPCGECEWCRGFVESPDYYEVDGASNNGVDKVRELIDNVSFVPVSGKYKIYIIDEVHMLSTGAFNALLKTLEEPPAHAIFILATTEIRKIPATVLSRAAVYSFQQISVDDISKRLLESSLPLTEDAAQLIARQSRGAMRNAWSIAEQAAAGDGEITAERVRELLAMNSSESVFGVLSGIKNSDYTAIASQMEQVIGSGNSLSSMLGDMEDALKDAVLSLAGLKISGSELYLSLLGSFTRDIDMQCLCALSDGIMAIKRDSRMGMTNESVIIRCISLSEKYRGTDAVAIKRIIEMECRLKRLEEEIKKAIVPDDKDTVSECTALEQDQNTDVTEEVREDNIPEQAQDEQPTEEKMEAEKPAPQMDFGLDDFDFFFGGADVPGRNKKEQDELKQHDNEVNQDVLDLTGKPVNEAVKRLEEATEEDLKKAELGLAEAMTKDAVLAECIRSCSEKSIKGNRIMIETPYKAVKKIIDKCLNVYSVSAEVNIKQ